MQLGGRKGKIRLWVHFPEKVLEQILAVFMSQTEVLHNEEHDDLPHIGESLLQSHWQTAQEVNVPQCIPTSKYLILRFSNHIMIVVDFFNAVYFQKCLGMYNCFRPFLHELNRTGIF